MSLVDNVIINMWKLTGVR